MNLRDKLKYENRIKELEAEVEKYKKEYLWAWGVLCQIKGGKI
jgi:hypothetical protein